ncbi:MAG: hypothetical protein QXX79_07675 [Candidatus Bathyarchaeia archaeon]
MRGTTKKHLRLKLWEEYVGVLREVICKNGVVKLVFEGDAVIIDGEAETFKRLINCKIGLLRTDSDTQAYRIRVLAHA